MLNVRKRVDGIPIFDKYDRPLYHLNNEQDSNKVVVIVDEINNIDGHYIKLDDCLKEKYDKIHIYTKSPLSNNSFTIEDQYSIKSVLNWINKWNNKKKNSKSIKFIKSKSKYKGTLNKEIPLIIKLFKYKNNNVEANTLHCNLYTEENILEENEKTNNNKKGTKTESKKKQNKKKTSVPKPSLLCIPIKSPKFNWHKKKEQKVYDTSMSIDDFQFQSSDLNSFLPIRSNNIFENHNMDYEENIVNVEKKSYNIERKQSMKRVNATELDKENPKKRNIEVNVTEKDTKTSDIIDKLSNVSYNEAKRISRNKQNLQSLTIPPNNVYKSSNPNSSKNLSASTLVSNEIFDYPSYQEPTSYIPSPSYSTASTLVSQSPVSPISPDNAKVDSKFEIDSCGYADYLKDRINEQSDNTDVTDIERKHFSMPVNPENIKKGKTRRRSYAFSLTSNELNLIYSEANQAVISGLCKTVESKQKNHSEDHKSSSHSKTGDEKPFVKGHARTQSRHRRSHAVCLSSDQIFNIGVDEDIKSNNRRSRYMNNENTSTNGSMSNNNKDSNTQLKRRSTNMVKYKLSNSSLSSSNSSNRNSFCSNSGSMRPVSTNRLSRDIDLLRAMKMKRSRSVPKLDQPDSSSSSSNRSPAKPRYSMDVSVYKENIGISLRSNSTNNLTPPNNIVYYSFGNKNESNLEGYKKVNNRGSYGLFSDTINQTNMANGRWSSVFDNGSSSCGSSTYYYSEEDGIHSNNNETGVVNSKEDLINYESANKGYNNIIQTESPDIFVQPPPPTPIISLI